MARFIYKGDRDRAHSLRSEGVRQLGLLKNAMRFQGLRQLKRIVAFTDGSRLVCSSVFGVDVVTIFGASTPVESKPEVKKVEFCWCNTCFARGIITEVIGDYGDFGPFYKNESLYQDTNKLYPKYCKYRYGFPEDTECESYISRYEGIRYRVTVCQGELGLDKEYVCIPSDFLQYSVGDAVIVLLMGIWPNGSTEQNRDAPLYLDSFAACECEYYAEIDATVLCQACMAQRRTDWEDSEAEGSYIILPLGITNINVTE